VVVLSSNDGCAVARSNEAKALGIPMGAPAFQYRQLFKTAGVVQFSANFELYGNVSKRITQILMQVTPRIEVYSVDESFLDLSALEIEDYGAWGRVVRARILQEIGVPVSVGIAPSKTLAKLASEIAKQHDEHRGAVSFAGPPPAFLEASLAATPVGEVWGVGRKLAPKLRAEGINTALQLSEMRPQYAQKLMGIHGRQLVSELNGTSCYPLELQGKIAKSILRSRTFGEDTAQAYVLEAAVASLATHATFRLRQAGLLARTIGVFANTNRHKPGYRRWVREVKLGTPLNDSGQIIRLLVDELPKIFVQGQDYHRLGVYLYDFVPAQALQTDLLGYVDTAAHAKATSRMQAIDYINQRHGKDKIHYAANDLSKTWQPKHQIRSPRYVSNWNELPEARIF
jgi:DNA polymerase V